MAIEILDRLVTFGLMIDRLMELGRKTVTIVPDVVKKRVARKLGSTTGESVKSFDDEGDYLKSVLTETLGKRVAGKALEFEEELRRKMPELAAAYVLALAKLAQHFEEGKEPGGASVAKLVQLLLQRKTFKERVAFIKGRGIETLVSPPEKDFPEELEKLYRKNYRIFQKGLEKDPYKGFCAEALGFNPKCMIPRRIRNIF